MRILFLSRWFPFPANNGSRIRIHNLLHTLGQHHDVSLVSFRNQGEACSHPGDSGVRLRDVRTVEWREFRPRSFRAALGYLSPLPRSFFSTYSPEMATLIRDRVRINRYDLVIASQIQMAAYRTCFQGVPALWEEAECGIYFQNLSSASTVKAKLRVRLTWLKHCQFFRNTLTGFNRCTVVSEPERHLLSSIAPYFRAVDVVPNALRVERYRGFRTQVQPKSLVFCGALAFQPNWEGVDWFAEKVLPIIEAAEPQAQFTLLGDPGNRRVPARRNMISVGHCDDVRPIVANSSVSVVPVLSGGGTRLKILESMALGTPVVTTSKGCEGLAVEHGRHLLVADTPDVFAAAVIHLLRSPEEQLRLAAAARACLAANYEWNIVQEKFLSIVDQAALEGAVRPLPYATAG